MPDIVSQLRQDAAIQPRRIVFPEASDKRVLAAAVQIAEMKMAHPILVGSPGSIERAGRELKLNLGTVEIVDAGSRIWVEKYTQLLLPRWRSRGTTEIE